MRRFRILAVVLAAVPTLGMATCWSEAGERYGVEPALLQAIGWQESRGWTHAVGPRLPDGNVALGVMQINTIHLPELAKYGIRRENLFDACTSQQIGAWVLARCMQQFGKTWKAVGCYYAGPASKNTKAQVEYVTSVQRWYEGYKRQEVEAGARRPALIASTASGTGEGK